METNQPGSLVIREHNFQEAKNSLKKYTEHVKEEVELSSVPYSGGLFHLGNHKVTGSEMNNITSQIQDCIISLNHLTQGLVEEIGQVYNAFEYLDKDYISGIVTSIKAAEKVSQEEQKDRKDIKELVEQHKQAIAVLKKFKADIEQLKHLSDIDKAWDQLEKQTRIFEDINTYISRLSALNHIEDVDVIYDDVDKLTKKYDLYIDKLSSFEREQAEKLSAVEKSQKEKLISIEQTQDKRLSSLEREQAEKLSAVEGSQKEKLISIEQTQDKRLSCIEKEQAEKLSAIEKSQKEKLISIEKKQALNWKETIKKLKAEKELRNEEVAAIIRKARYTYYLAGGAAVLTVVQFVLNVLGVI